ncbi:hypothetical protein M404DRAFT_159837 [Pisolithus tinctorius Marx 270]|uniref:Tf2-1-like SH3-like domain-containing protein n=1 Tax=Pisolithus tinctorius Marx 270 TaxID=870435 RepID=A0A0C3N9D0_PISTI|nr:hypothetical protein M404DRAFT_159837 [Pisolithus tinctorius Marx 270]
MGIKPMTSKVEAAEEVAKSWFQVFQDIKANLTKAHSWQKQQVDRGHLTAPSYSSCKLSKKWIRPYEVLEVLPNALKLKLLHNMRIHLVVNVSWVKPYLSALDGQCQVQAYSNQLQCLTRSREGFGSKSDTEEQNSD